MRFMLFVKATEDSEAKREAGELMKDMARARDQLAAQH
jgi:hypothetical protein